MAAERLTSAQVDSAGAVNGLLRRSPRALVVREYGRDSLLVWANLLLAPLFAALALRVGLESEERLAARIEADAAAMRGARLPRQVGGGPRSPAPRAAPPTPTGAGSPSSAARLPMRSDAMCGRVSGPSPATGCGARAAGALQGRAPAETSPAARGDGLGREPLGTGHRGSARRLLGRGHRRLVRGGGVQPEPRAARPDPRPVRERRAARRGGAVRGRGAGEPPLVGWSAARQPFGPRPLLAISTVFTLWARLALGISWIAAPEVEGDRRLRTSGPYGVTRHRSTPGFWACRSGWRTGAQCVGSVRP